MTVSDLLIKILGEFGVRQIFGIPGDAINDVTEAIRTQNVIDFIQVRHEETGAFAAAAQAKLTGKLGVCMGTSGPGAIHLLNGLYDAKLDHAPVLAITGHVDTKYMGTDYHQEVDLYSLFDDVTVFNQVITNPDQVPHLFIHACQQALANNGVSHISLPVDIAGRAIKSNAEDSRPITCRFGETVPCAQDLEAAAKLIDESDRIAILAGIGCRDRRDDLIEFAEKAKAPIIRSLRAKEVLPDMHPMCIGGLGNLGSEPGVEAIEKCDLLILAGTDFPYHDYFPDGTKAIQIDIEPTHLGKRYPVDIGLTGHAGPTLKALSQQISAKKDSRFLTTMQKRMRNWFDKQAPDETSDRSPIKPQRLAFAISEAADDNAIFLCDTGTVTVWGARHLRLRDNQRYTLSSALASMAFGLPAAIGAQLSFPDRQVIALVGDGGFHMLMGDFITAVKYDLPVTIVIFNNAKLGMIQMEQEAGGRPEYQTDLLNPDYAKFAEICGGVGYSVSNPDELDKVLASAFSNDKPCIVDAAVNPEEVTMPPKVSAKQAVGYAIAKVKEFTGA